MSKTTIDSGLASLVETLRECEDCAARSRDDTEDYDLQELAKSDLKFINGLQLAIKKYIKDSYNCFDDMDTIDSLI